MQIKITAHTTPLGKLADVELHFQSGPLAGLKLIGFSVWQRRGGSGLNVTFPARQYSVNGERRTFSLLRPIVLDIDGERGQTSTADNRLRDLILAAYASFEAGAYVSHADGDFVDGDFSPRALDGGPMLYRSRVKTVCTAYVGEDWTVTSNRPLTDEEAAGAVVGDLDADEEGITLACVEQEISDEHDRHVVSVEGDRNHAGV